MAGVLLSSPIMFQVSGVMVSATGAALACEAGRTSIDAITTTHIVTNEIVLRTIVRAAHRSRDAVDITDESNQPGAFPS